MMKSPIQVAWRASLHSALALLFGTFSILFTTNDVNAHPHVWVTVKSEVLYGADGSVTGVKHKWQFDEFYSSFATQGLDLNKDGVFDRKELAELAKLNVESLNEFDYFTFAKQGETSLERAEPKDYWLVMENGILTLYFTLPLAKPADPLRTPVKLSVYDPTFYISFEFAKENPVTLASNAPSGCSATLSEISEKEQQTAKNLSEAFLSEDDDFGTIALELARDAVISCKKDGTG